MSRPNPTAPHKIVIFLRAEVREVLPTGEIHGNIAHAHPPANSTERFEVFAITAEDRDIAIRKLNEFIQEVRTRK